MVGQMFQPRQLQPRQRDMVGVQVQGDDFRLRAGKVIQDVAAAAGDGQHAVMRRQLQRLQIHAGIFPYLVIDEALKHQGEKPLHGAPAGTQGALMGGAFQEQIGHDDTFANRQEWDRAFA